MRKPSLDKIIEANKDKTGHIPNKGRISLSTNGWLDQYKRGGGYFPEYHSYAPPRMQNGGSKPKYKDWLKTVNPDFISNDYNLKEAYSELPYNMMQAWVRDPRNNHLPDTYKLPTHESFSNQSKYYDSVTPGVGGYWGEGDDVYIKNPKVGPPIPNAKWMGQYANGGDISIPDLNTDKWLMKYQYAGQYIPGVTDFKMPLNRTDTPGLSVQEKQRKETEALEMQRRNNATAKRQFIGQAKTSTPESEARRIQLNKLNTANLPNVQRDEFGNTSRINPNMTYAGEPANFMGERQQKGYEHIMGALDAAGYVTGAGELANAGYNAIKPLIAESMESGLLSRFKPVFNLSNRISDKPLSIATGNYLKNELVTKNMITPGELEAIRNRELAWLDNPEYIKRRMAATGETAEEVAKAIQNHKDNLNRTSLQIVEFPEGDLTVGEYDHTISGPTIRLNKFTDRESALGTYDHEVGHATSQIHSLGNYPGYPKIKLGNPISRFFNSKVKYYSQAPEQQVRFQKLLKLMEDEGGIPRGQKITPEIYNTFAKQLLNSPRKNLISAKYDDVAGLLNLIKDKYKSNYRPILIDALNKSYVTVPSILGAAALQNNEEVPQKKKGGIIKDNRGQWAHPGQPTRISSPNITMQGVPYPVAAYPSNSHQPTIMEPGKKYHFPFADYVDEYPMMQKAGWLSKYAEGGMSQCPPGFIKNAAGQCVVAGLDVSNKSTSDATRVVNPSMTDQGVLTKDITNTNNFNRGWIQSPMYKDMLGNSVANSTSSADKNIPDLRERLSSDPSRIQVVQKNLNDPTTGGTTESLPYTATGPLSKVTVNTNTIIPRQETIDHEILGHATDLGGALIPKPDKEKMNKYFTPQEKIDTSSADPIKMYANTRGMSYADAKKQINENLKNPEWAKEWNKHVSEVNEVNKQAAEINKAISDEDNYIGRPSETRARMMTIRKLAKDKGIYDPFTQKMTRESLRKLKSLNNFELDSLFQNYTEDELLDMFNSISMNEQPNNPTMAKYGGWLSKYADGGSLCKDMYGNTIECPPGYTAGSTVFATNTPAVSDNTTSIINRPKGVKRLQSNPNPVVGPVRKIDSPEEVILNTTGKLLDPTGISSWGDAGVAIGEAIDDPSLLNVLGAGMETLGALPLVHYLGAGAKVPKTISEVEKAGKLNKVKKALGTTAKWISGEPIIAGLDKVTGTANLMPNANKLLVGINRSNRFINNIVKPAIVSYYSTPAQKSQALQSSPNKYLTFKRTDGSTFTVDASDTSKVNQIRDAITSMNADSTFNVETEYLPTWASPSQKKKGGEAWLNKYL